MLLWWIIAAVLGVTAGWVVLDMIISGEPVGALIGHLNWIIPLFIAMALFLLARGGLKRWRSIQRQDEPFASYPEGHVLAVFHSSDEARAVQRELEEEGLTNGRVKVFADVQGAASLDSEGTAHGVTAFAERELEHLVSDKDDLAEYETAVRRGAMVIGVEAPDEPDRDRVVEIFRRHGADRVNYFGRWAVETVEPGPDRMGSKGPPVAEAEPEPRPRRSRRQR
jgi:hypothetical protein